MAAAAPSPDQTAYRERLGKGCDPVAGSRLLAARKPDLVTHHLAKAAA